MRLVDLNPRWVNGHPDRKARWASRRRRSHGWGKPALYLGRRRRGLRRFAGALVAFAVALCVLAVFG